MATETQSLARIFNNSLFRIPDYQRGYAWGKEQLDDFWSDLQRVGSDRTHYCGQLTLEKASDQAWKLWTGDHWLIKDADYTPYLVVDGQQRLTTSIILLQCLLEDLDAADLIAGQKVSEIRERYLVKGVGILRSCLFGYEKDNPSHEFFRTQILGVPSNAYNGTQTVYTNNLINAKDYFKTQLESAASLPDREKLFKALTQRFRFNLHELSDDIDVFVAFETMNNRGKPLTRLELLKNRLIYLSTLAPGSAAARQKVRDNINTAWMTIYQELGRNPEVALDDDDFLRAHWIVYFGYDKDEANPLTKFLLNEHFTTKRLDNKDLDLTHIQAYADSLQSSAKIWQQLAFPEKAENSLDPIVASALIRLNRLGVGVFRPLILSAFSTKPASDDLSQICYQIERFQLLARSFARTRSDSAEADSYRVAYDIHHQKQPLTNAVLMLQKRVAKHFSSDEFQRRVLELFKDEEKAGFYSLPAVKFVLFEYEEDLARKAKASAAKFSWYEYDKARNSVEHIYPRRPNAGEWPSFDLFSELEKRFLTHSLGNLVAISVPKNSSLSRQSFQDKKTGVGTNPSYSQGSYSELEIAQYPDWTPLAILERGLKLLRFVEDHWEVSLGGEAEKTAILQLSFLKK